MKKSFSIAPGTPLPFGATITPDGINFAVFSRHADTVSLVLFILEAKKGNNYNTREIALDPMLNKTGDVWHILVQISYKDLMYGFKIGGPYDPSGLGHFYSRDKILLDPYARALADGEEWGVKSSKKDSLWGGFNRRCLVVEDNFDWEGDRPLNIPLKDSIIYEMHVRGYTIHPSAGVNHPGTYSGIIEKIPYLQELGVTAIELMPITEFNENENVRKNPLTDEQLKNFWGYSPLSFFSPKASYATNGLHGNQVYEFKEMVKQLHKAGIEVILDVVFNHTAEGGSDGPMSSFRGLDNSIYYLLDQKTGEYLNFSGCGNTLNCNHPLVRQLIMDCLRYWVIEMHVDGFRFDLASVLGRDQNGEVLSDPPMVEKIAEDPILANTKIIAEAWDAAGLYQVGNFSTSPRWAEWNGKFRDDVRKFMCSMEDMVPALATRIAGSSDLYQKYGHPYNSINFITSHDGFTLKDLVSFNTKKNISNGEDNKDGLDHNISWDSGAEGDTSSTEINQMRDRRIRTFAVILFLSQGVPMLVAGDEFGRTQQGNNNAYCQDNEISWVDWRLADENGDLLRFFSGLIALRKKHSVFRRADFFSNTGKEKSNEIIWQSIHNDETDWSYESKTLAFYLNGQASGSEEEDDFFVMLNGHRTSSKTFQVPLLSEERNWRKIIDSAAMPPKDFTFQEEAEEFPVGTKVKVEPMGAVVLIAKVD